MADIAKRVEQYVRLRDMIKSKEDEHKKAIKPLKDTLVQLNSVLLAHLNGINGQSVATENGTVYRTEKKSLAGRCPGIHGFRRRQPGVRPHRPQGQRDGGRRVHQGERRPATRGKLLKHVCCRRTPRLIRRNL